MDLDKLGTLASLLATCYFVRLNVLAWPITLIAIALNSYLYLRKGIYADTCLEGVYFLTTWYGWYHWKNEKKINTGLIKTMPFYHWISMIFLTCLLFSIIRYLLLHFTASEIPNIDAFTASLSIIAQLLICSKRIETWILWLIADSTYLYLYLQKALPFHAFLMLVYIGIAIWGYYSWYKQKKQQKQLSPGF